MRIITLSLLLLGAIGCASTSNTAQNNSDKETKEVVRTPLKGNPLWVRLIERKR